MRNITRVIHYTLFSFFIYIFERNAIIFMSKNVCRPICEVSDFNAPINMNLLRLCLTNFERYYWCTSIYNSFNLYHQNMQIFSIRIAALI